MDKISVIAFIGKAGSGKTIAAQYLVISKGYKRLSFSDGLKKMLYSLGIGYDYLYGNKKNECPEELCGRTARHAMITLGTEWGRDIIHHDIWVKAMERNMSKCMYEGTTNFVIDDVRFLNEAKFVKELSGSKKIRVDPVVMSGVEIGMNPRVFEVQTRLVRLLRYMHNDIKHQSEIEQDEIEVDENIYNNGSIESLYTKLDNLLYTMKE